MTDERAVLLANLLAEYARASVAEGATLQEVGSWTILDTINDIVSTTPQYLEHNLDTLAIEYAEGEYA
jgi:hypothetical protein